MVRSRYISFALASVSVVTIASTAIAQDSGAMVWEEIVVTAQKREQRVQDVPLSISVIDQAQLERQQVNSLMDLMRVAPSLELGSAVGQAPGGGGQIRGIGTQSFLSGTVGSVGIVVDQVSQGNVNIADLFDIARVEVLKGPQGTLFGLTASAGVINISTNAPDPSGFSARVRTEISDAGTLGAKYGQQILQGVVNVPVADTAALRISAFGNVRQGGNRNARNGELDDHSNYGVRGRFLWEPSEKVTLNLIGEYTKTKDSDGPEFILPYVTTPTTQAATYTPCGITVNENNRDYCLSSNFPTQRSKSYGFSGQIDYDAGPFTITSISAYRKQDSGPNFLNIYRLDGFFRQILQGPSTSETDLLSQEFRISSPSGEFIEYTAGLFYSRQRSDNPPSQFTLAINGNPQIPPSGLSNRTEVDDESYAAFGQVTVNVTDSLGLIGGLRYTSEDMEVTSTLANMSASRTEVAKVRNWSWRTGLQYDISDNTMSYATVSRGYKGPQVSVANPAVPTAVSTVVSEEVPTNYEIGFKHVAFNGQVIVDLSAFYMDIRDYQGQNCRTVPPANNLVCQPQNIDGVKSKGAEINVFGRPFESLSLNTGLMYNRATYPTGYIASDGQLIEGQQLRGAPKWKFTLSGEYSHQVANAFEGFVALDAVHKSKIRHAVAVDPLIMYGAHWHLGGRLGLRAEEGRWSVAIFGRNLLDEREPVYRILNSPAPGTYGQILSTQSYRTVGLSFDARF